MREFNTSGPNIQEEHYTLPRTHLVQQGKNWVYNEHYFCNWLPHQTGKTTYFKFLADELREEGYKVAFINFGHFRIAQLEGFLNRLKTALIKQWEIQFQSNTLDGLFQEIENIKTGKCVLIIDEVEGINEAFLGDFLHSVRKLYHSRQEHCLKSVILVGVMNIVGVVKSHASPFNIAEKLPIPYFTNHWCSKDFVGCDQQNLLKIFLLKKFFEKVKSLIVAQKSDVSKFEWFRSQSASDG